MADITASPDRASSRATAIAGLVLAGLVLAALAGCTGEADSAGPAERAGEPSAPAVVSHQGLDGIRFGDARADLERDHGLTQQPGDCAPQLPPYPGVSPVFEDDRLVLLWAEPPLRTPEGLGVGTAVATVRDTHRGAEELAAPPGTYRFDGLLAVTGDRDAPQSSPPPTAYLFLHDGTTVQKLVVGYEEHCRRLFHEGFGAC